MLNLVPNFFHACPINLVSNLIKCHVSLSLRRSFQLILWVNHQIRPWIFMGRPNLSLNYVKYQLSPWICQTSIKKVPPSKCSISHADLSPCMLCCLVHVAKRKPRVQGLIWLIVKKFQFSLFSFIFYVIPILSLYYSYLLLHISLRNIKKTSLTLLLPVKLSSFSPLQNHHHLRRFSRFWSCVQLWLLPM